MWCVLTILYVCLRCKYCNNTYLSYILYSEDEVKVLSRVWVIQTWTYIFSFACASQLLHREIQTLVLPCKQNKSYFLFYNFYVISIIIISVSCQWVCLYRKFLFRSITSLHWIMGVCQIIVGSLCFPREKNNVTRHLVLCLSHFPLVKITFM